MADLILALAVSVFAAVGYFAMRRFDRVLDRQRKERRRFLP